MNASLRRETSRPFVVRMENWRQKMHYLSHYNKNQLCIFSENSKKRTMDGQINRMKSAPRKNAAANAKRDLMLFAPNVSVEKGQRTSCTECLLFDSANIFIFALGGAPFIRLPFSHWHSVCTAVNDYSECNWWKRPKP